MKTFPHIYNIYEAIRADPTRYRQFECDQGLMTEFNCPLQHRVQPLWSQYNHILFVLEGKKIWHTPAGAYEMTAGSCAFVRKGGRAVEQFFDSNFCVIVFFLSDDFICETLRPVLRSAAAQPAGETAQPVIRLQMDDTLTAFLHSMLPYFNRMQPPEKMLLGLKFRELLLNIAGNSHNRAFIDYCCALLQIPEPAAVLRSVMEENFCYNLPLDAYAQLCNRSLSAFKRDFQKVFQTTPGKWLLTKRLDHARHLLAVTDKTVSEVAFESGFENLSHFSRVFRERFGASPAALRTQAVY